MTIKKTVAIATAVGALAALSVPAMALENEFHGMYRAYGYYTNALSGAGGFNLAKDSATDKFIEQRARLMYTAKASDDLKLVTHFELDTKFGGSHQTKYTQTAAGNSGSDAGAMDADRVTLETKNVYLDFNCPLTGANAKVGIQPFNDAYQGTWGNFDATGVAVSKKFGAFTGTYAYFTVANADATGSTFNSDRKATDVNVLDAKYAVSKDLTVGANYYSVWGDKFTGNYVMHMVGANAAGKFGPAAVTASLGYQLGDNTNIQKISAFGGAVAAKIDAGPGKVNASVLYLSGDDAKNAKTTKAWQTNAAANYFTPANMWLITRNAATINSSTAIGGSADLTRGGRGILGVFAGYEGTKDKMYYNANLGYAQVNEKRTAKSGAVGTELNATVGYKLYPALTVSATAAYAILGDGYGNTTGTLLPGGAANADDPFLTNVALNFSF